MTLHPCFQPASPQLPIPTPLHNINRYQITGGTERTYLSCVRHAACVTCMLSKNNGKLLFYLTQESKMLCHDQTPRLLQTCITDAVIALLTMQLLQRKAWTNFWSHQKLKLDCTSDCLMSNWWKKYYHQYQELLIPKQSWMKTNKQKD